MTSADMQSILGHVGLSFSYCTISPVRWKPMRLPLLRFGLRMVRCAGGRNSIRCGQPGVHS
jgi:hypothetical protein